MAFRIGQEQNRIAARAKLHALINARQKSSGPKTRSGSGQLASVTDPAGRGVLTFSYTSDLLTSVTDWAERTVEYGYDTNGRLQTVTREENALYHDLIKTFEARTGIPVLLNTSFNENEPIVCTPAEAIDCYLRTKMDVLALGPFLCKKPPAA